MHCFIGCYVFNWLIDFKTCGYRLIDWWIAKFLISDLVHCSGVFNSCSSFNHQGPFLKKKILEISFLNRILFFSFIWNWTTSNAYMSKNERRERKCTNCMNTCLRMCVCIDRDHSCCSISQILHTICILH